MSRKPSRRIYIVVDYSEKEDAKRLGARWDGEGKKWYIPVRVDPEPLISRWSVIEGVPSPAPRRNSPASTQPSQTDPDGKLVAAKVLGRLGGIAGGSKGGHARAEAISPERRSEIARMGAAARNAKQAERQAKRMMEQQGRLAPEAESGMEQV